MRRALYRIASTCLHLMRQLGNCKNSTITLSFSSSLPSSSLLSPTLFPYFFFVILPLYLALSEASRFRVYDNILLRLFLLFLLPRFLPLFCLYLSLKDFASNNKIIKFYFSFLCLSLSLSLSFCLRHPERIPAAPRRISRSPFSLNFCTVPPPRLVSRLLKRTLHFFRHTRRCSSSSSSFLPARRLIYPKSSALPLRLSSAHGQLYSSSSSV